MADAVKALGGSAPVESKDVTITGPDIAENGAVVPVGAATALPGVKRLLLLVEKNPNVLAAMFDVTDAVEANVSTRVEDGPVVQRVRGGDDGRRQGAVRRQGNQGHARRLRRLTRPRPSRPPNISRRTDMADPMRIRAQAAGDKTTVRVLMSSRDGNRPAQGFGRQADPGLVHPGGHARSTTARPC